jgi:hypothetical protein
MAQKKSDQIPVGQVNLFDLFGMNTPPAVVVAPPPPAPVEPVAAAGPTLPDGWTLDDIRFLLNVLEEGPILVAVTELGIPTIHSNFGAEVVHCGFGLMKVEGLGYKLTFDAGGAMQRTPSGNGWTRLTIEGKYPYDAKLVREKLEAYLPKDDAPQATALPPVPAEEPERDYEAEKKASTLKLIEERKRDQTLPQYMIAIDDVDKLPFTMTDESLIRVYCVGRDVELVTGEVVTISGFFGSAGGKYIETLQAGENMIPPGVELNLEPDRDRCIHKSFLRGVLLDEQQEAELGKDIRQLFEMAKPWLATESTGEQICVDSPANMVALALEVKEAGAQLEMAGSVDTPTLEAFRGKVWSVMTRASELESLADNQTGEEQQRTRDVLGEIEDALGGYLDMSYEFMKCTLLKLLLPENLRSHVKVETGEPATVAFFENGYALKLDLQLTADGELPQENVKVVVAINTDSGLIRNNDAPVKDCMTTVEKLPKVFEEMMKLKNYKKPVEDQVKEFRSTIGYFTGTEKWTRYPGLCPHIILLTDGALFVAENGGEDGNSAFWLMDAIASYQGEAALKHHEFQVWKLVVHLPDEPGPAQNTVMAVLQSKPGHAPEKPFNPHRHASLICTNGNEKELVRQEIDMTDFLPVGEVTLYASVEDHPDVSTKQKVMIILLSSEY